MAVTRLILSDYRNYPALELAPGPGFVLLSGRNGAGKTNILEALSLLAPGRGLRAAPLADIARIGGAGGFAVAARLGEVELGTGTLADVPDRRKVRINGAPAPVNALADYLSILWLTPAMDRLFAGSSGDRRRFLDRLVLASEPSHARHSARYEAAMRSRNRLLGEVSREQGWLDALEAQMVDHGGHVAKARERTVTALDERLTLAPADEFLKASVALTAFQEDDFAAALRVGRSRDAKAGRTLVGPHRQDLIVARRDTRMPASHCSTGEQKALLLGVVLAHAEVVADRQARPPLLLLDEVAAHLDPRRREALFARLDGRGQVWMTATEASLFDGIGEATHYVVADGRVERSP